MTGHAAGDTAVYTCARDHVLVGGEERLCQDTRTWTGADPYCKHQGTGNLNLCQNLVVLQKVPSEANPKVRYHGEGPY